MRILQISKFYYPELGGIERIVQQIAEGISKDMGFEVGVLCCSRNAKGKVEMINGVKIWRAKILCNFWGMPISFQFFNILKQLRTKFDLIDFHHPFPLGDLAIFLFLSRKDLIVHYHSDIVRQKPLEIFVKPFIFNTLKKAKRIIVSNPNLAKTSPYLQKFREKCIVVPFGVEIKKYQRPNLAKVREIKEKYKDFILFVGRLTYYKGVQYLIKAMRDVNANLVIIGEGKEKTKLKKLTKNLNLEKKIFFLSYQKENDLINFYHASKIFVLPSIYKAEAFGIVLIEAMACKKPVVSTELGTGTSWVNINNQTGLVIPLKNEKALKRAIEFILNNKKIAEEMGEKAFLRIKNIFLEDKMIKEIKKLYQEVYSALNNK